MQLQYLPMAASQDEPVAVVGLDHGDQSLSALRWSINHLIVPFLPGPPPIRLLIVHAKPSPVSALAGVGPGAVAVLPIVEVDLKKAAAVVIEKAKSICDSNSVYDAEFEVVEGDARYVLCEAVERHHASMLVVGSHGYGALKRAFLGSVSDYCIHNASCSVVIVKSPRK